MSKKYLEAQLAAGGMVSAAAKVDQGATEKVVARRYVGPALGDRVVVRLGADRLGPAEDLAMEFLGLQSAGESKPIAQQSRRALGFASWALITHPENAKYALNLVKRIKAAARKAKSKPGHAWDQFSAMADELNRSVRHFLPPFWEESARIYKDLGNTTYAGRAIGKALEAERVHALDVDPHRRRDAVLEFTLSGCLSGKALGEYTKDLEKQFEPAEAFETLRDLLVRRTMGGMPPLTTAAKDLGRFAKAAGKDPDEEIESLLEAIIASPAMSRTTKQFWTSVSKQVARLVARDDTFGVWLLVHTDPQSSYAKESPVWGWLDLLDKWKVLPLLGKPADELPPEAEIPGGRAGWISRLAAVESSPHKRIFDLIDLTADAIRAEGQPIRFGHGGYYGGVVDVDVLEQCLDLGLEVTDIPPNRELDFDGWLRAEVDHPRRNSQLTHLVADDRFRPKVFDKIPALVQFKASSRLARTYGRTVATRRSFESAAAGHDAIRDIWWQFLDGQLKQVEQGGLRDFEVAIGVLEKCLGKTTGEQFPEVLKRLKKVDMPAVLHRTLAAGVIDEYGWKALDDADDEEKLPQVTRRRSHTVASFPIVTLLRQGKTETVGPQGRRTIGEFVLGKDEIPEAVLPVVDDVLLVYRDQTKGYDTWIKWLRDPDKPHKSDQYFFYFDAASLIQHDDGVFYGSRILRPGDTQIPNPAFWMSDGERFWTLDQERRAWNEFDVDGDRPKPAGLQEIDPNTGKKVRSSIPAWFEDQLPSGGMIFWPQCQLFPAPAGTEASPLGVKDGMIGWRVVRRRDGHHESRGIDGRSNVFAPGKSSEESNVFALAMIDQPAGDSHWIVTNTDELIDAASGIKIADISGTITRYRDGQPMVLPLLFWHYFTVRCPESSKKLRKITLAESKVLFQAGAIEHEALKHKADPKHPDPNRTAAATAVSKLLPKAPQRLVKGISRIARMAAVENVSLEKTIDVVSGEAAARKEREAAKQSKGKESTPTASWDEIQAGLAELVYPLEAGGAITSRGYGGNTTVNPQQILEIIRFFNDGTVKEFPEGEGRFFAMIDDLPTAAWKTFWKHAHQGADDGVAVQQRLEGPWLDALTFLANSGLYDLPGKMTLFTTSELEDAPIKKLEKQRKLPSANKPIALVEGKIRYVVYLLAGYQSKTFAILAYAEKGDPKPPKVYPIAETVPLRKRWMSSSAKAFVKAVTELETLPLIEAERLEGAATTLGISPIQVALAWMGNYRSARYGQEKLTKELRNHYGWKVADIKTAVKSLEADPPLPSILSEGTRLDAAGCVGNKSHRAFNSVIHAWRESQKAFVPIPPEVLGKLQNLRMGYRQIDQKSFHQLLAEPQQSPLLRNFDVSFEFNKNKRAYQMITQVFSPQREESPIYTTLMDGVCMLNYELPVGDPARRVLPDLLEAIGQWLDHDSTTLPFGKYVTQQGYNTEVDKEATLAKFSSVVAACQEGSDGLYRMDSGLIVGAICPPAVSLRFRTSKLRTQSDFDTLLAAASITFDYETVGSTELRSAEFVLAARDAVVDSLIAGNRNSPFPEGSWEQDPRISVPDLVGEVSKKLKVSEPAAMLYLQVLALHDPTGARVKAWNGWSAKELKSSAEELIAGDHLVAAKRSRAGRDYFLPGGWEALKIPNLPIESWKLPLFGYENTERLRGGYPEPIVCPRTVPDQFRLAWDRVASGDAPKYEEATLS